MNLLDFFREYDTSLLIALGTHFWLVALSLVIASAIGIPLSFLILRSNRSASITLAVLNGIQTIPSIALFALMIPLLVVIDRSVGQVPATIALVLYSLLPIVRSSYDALRSASAEAIEAARGSGMSDRDIDRLVLLPLSLPGMMSGVRLATTGGIGVAAVASYIGAGGLGDFIQRGIATTWSTMIVGGVIAIILVTIAAELLLWVAERLVTPEGVRASQRRRR